MSPNKIFTSHIIVQIKVAGDIIAKDGFGSLYKGLSAGLLRQATYTTARMGIFEEFKGILKERNGTQATFSTSLSSLLPRRNMQNKNPSGYSGTKLGKHKCFWTKSDTSLSLTSFPNLQELANCSLNRLFDRW